MKIVTQEQLRGCWVAVDEDTYTGPPDKIGTGFSEREAIEDLLDQLRTSTPQSKQSSEPEMTRDTIIDCMLFVTFMICMVTIYSMISGVPV